MNSEVLRGEIIASGLVQGVGFRWFVMKNAQSLGLKGFTQNLYSGEVYTVVEGEKLKIDELLKKIKIGPSHANVRDVKIKWTEAKNEFSRFEIRH